MLHLINNMAELTAQCESNGNPFALRYEPAHAPSLTLIALAARYNKCSLDTGKMICMSSWGLYQIMGDSLYSEGLIIPIGQYLGSATWQDMQYHQFCVSRDIVIDLATFISDKAAALNYCHHYNGNAAVYYEYLRAALIRDGWAFPDAI